MIFPILLCSNNILLTPVANWAQQRRYAARHTSTRRAAARTASATRGRPRRPRLAGGGAAASAAFIDCWDCKQKRHGKQSLIFRFILGDPLRRVGARHFCRGHVHFGGQGSELALRRLLLVEGVVDDATRHLVNL
jgi:hypothetical protein